MQDGGAGPAAPAGPSGAGASGGAGLPAAGYRTAPHPADLVIEGWGPTLAECVGAAVRALVSGFADTSGSSPTGELGFRVSGASPEDLLVGVLDEVIYRLDADGVVPVDVRVEQDPEGELDIRLGTVDAGEVGQTGPVPKGVALSGLRVEREPAGWRCRALVDV